MQGQKTPPNPDALQQRCPRLGGTVNLAYCRLQGEGGLPCFKVFDCWWEVFDVVGYFRRSLSEAEFRKVAAARPKPKVASILEIVEETRKRLEK